MNLILDNELIENFTFDEISIGQSARLLRTLTLGDIEAFAAVSGDTNPAHLDEAYANDTLFHGVIAHGMWGGFADLGAFGHPIPGARHHLFAPRSPFQSACAYWRHAHGNGCGVVQRRCPQHGGNGLPGCQPGRCGGGAWQCAGHGPDQKGAPRRHADASHQAA